MPCFDVNAMHTFFTRVTQAARSGSVTHLPSLKMNFLFE
jgi:hypothetical protein